MRHNHPRRKKIESHILKVHKRSPASTYLKEVIYGGIDGIITTFAVVAGFSGAAFSNDTTTQLSFLVVLLFGLANLFADGVSMGLGSFLAVRSEKTLYNSIRTGEERESRCNEDIEAEETKLILMERGFSEVDAQTLTSIYQKNDQFWVDFLMHNELKITDPTEESPLYTGFATFISFISFGFIPLLPFMIVNKLDPQTVFIFSIFSTGVALVLLGVLKWKIIGVDLIKSVLEIVLVGTVAASVAFLVGTLFTL